jgi:hypothetical protein
MKLHPQVTQVYAALLSHKPQILSVSETAKPHILTPSHSNVSQNMLVLFHLQYLEQEPPKYDPRSATGQRQEYSPVRGDIQILLIIRYFHLFSYTEKTAGPIKS